jgi:hypothetical protein
VITAGLAELAAGSIAMGLGGYLAARADREHCQTERAREFEETETKPAEEREEVAEIFRGYGLPDEPMSARGCVGQTAVDGNGRAGSGGLVRDEEQHRARHVFGGDRGFEQVARAVVFFQSALVQPARLHAVGPHGCPQTRAFVSVGEDRIRGDHVDPHAKRCQF